MDRITGENGRYSGGFIGRLDAGVTVTGCYATGDVKSGGDFLGGGGLVGDNQAGTIVNCYATGNVIAMAENRCGGLVGVNRYGGSIINCYATGSASRQGAETAGFFGGLTPSNSGTIENSFWDMDTSGLTSSAGGTGKTTAQMQDIRTYTDVAWSDGLDAAWDFNEAWMIRDGCSYPRFTWQEFALFNVDINLDGMIDIADLRVLAAYWLESGVCADISGNGVVDLTDFVILASYWLSE